MRQDETRIVQMKSDGTAKRDYGQVYHDARYFRSQIMAEMGRRLTRGLRRR